MREFNTLSWSSLTNQSESRRYSRQSFARTVEWDSFIGAKGLKACEMINLSAGGCLIRSSEEMQNSRWVRVVLKDEAGNLIRAVIGWVVRIENEMGLPSGQLRYRYGIEFLPTTARTLSLLMD